MVHRLVFLVRIKSGCTKEQYIEAWEDGSAIIQQEPGSMGTRLYPIDSNTLVAMALWESQAHFEASRKKLGRLDDNDSDLNSVTHRHRLFGETTILDEIAAVDPPKPTRRPKQLSKTCEGINQSLATFTALAPGDQVPFEVEGFHMCYGHRSVLARKLGLVETLVKGTQGRVTLYRVHKRSITVEDLVELLDTAGL